jgi:hypothetical protein
MGKASRLKAERRQAREEAAAKAAVAEAEGLATAEGGEEENEPVDRTRRSLVFGLAGLGVAAGAGAILASISGDGDSEGADGGGAEPVISGAKPAGTAVETSGPLITKEVKAGKLTFRFSEEFTESEAQKFKRILEVTYEHISKYVPITDDLEKVIHVNKATTPYSWANYQEDRLDLNFGSTEGLIVHELVHIFHGDRDLDVNFIEEGLAVAISNLIVEEAELDPWDVLADLQVNKTMRDGGLSVMAYVPYHAYFPLVKARYYFSGQIWAEMEKKRPGFIRDFHQAYYAFLDEGGDKRALAYDPVFDLLKSIDASELFDEVGKPNPTMRYNKKFQEKDLVYVMYTKFLGEIDNPRQQSEQLTVYIVHKDKHGLERPVSSRELFKFRVTNLETGEESIELHTYSRPDGRLTINLNAFANRIGRASKYKISYTVPGVLDEPEEFEFNVNW